MNSRPENTFQSILALSMPENCRESQNIMASTTIVCWLEAPLRSDSLNQKLILNEQSEFPGVYFVHICNRSIKIEFLNSVILSRYCPNYHE